MAPGCSSATRGACSPSSASSDPGYEHLRDLLERLLQALPARLRLQAAHPGRLGLKAFAACLTRRGYTVTDVTRLK